MYDVFSMKDFRMPDGFLWGSGYAGHQVEGGNVHSDHWKMEQDGLMEEASGMACNSYELYQTDIDLVCRLGHRAFRTSVCAALTARPLSVRRKIRLDFIRKSLKTTASAVTF